VVFRRSGFGYLLAYLRRILDELSEQALVSCAADQWDSFIFACCFDLCSYCLMSIPASFPRGGQIWEVIDGCDAQIQYLFTAPITFSGSGRLTAGERVRIMTGTTDPQPMVVSFLPVRYDELHDSLVPPNIRDTPRYKQYKLSVETGYFYDHFRLLEDVA
jgi:hypothetical protein